MPLSSHSKTSSVPPPKPNWNGRAPITFTLAAVIGLLVLITTGVVSGVAIWLAQKNTFSLLSANAHQAVSADVKQVERHLLPAEYQTQYIADRIVSGEINSSNRESLGSLLIGALAAAPQIDAVVFVDTSLQSLRAVRNVSNARISLGSFDETENIELRETLNDISQGPIWLPPIWSSETDKTFLSRAHPIYHNGDYVGAVLAVVSVENLSSSISNDGLSDTGNRFILYGQGHVLAHWMMTDGYPERADDIPLPELGKFGDPILASIWQQQGHHELPLELPAGTDSHALHIFGDNFSFLYKTLNGFGKQPLIVGAYFQPSDIPEELRRFITALIAGLAALVLSLIAAIVIGHKIAQPIVQFSKAANGIQQLDIAKVKDLPGSLFRELNDQSLAFNAMLRALRWFEMYVPKKIVQQLIKHGDVQDASTDAREITVMFTDIAGFSTVSEGMTAPEVAAFVNHHFSLVVGCIESEDGIVDKFMGDAVMAFWDTSDANESTAEKACRAALSISKTIDKDNRLRELNGDVAVGIRIGIHTGMATVGNIGAPGRLNFTIIGDTVNIGQRLEQLGKEIYPKNTEISVLISSDTANQLSTKFNPIAAGSQKIKGRIGQIDVFKLE